MHIFNSYAGCWPIRLRGVRGSTFSLIGPQLRTAQGLHSMKSDVDHDLQRNPRTSYRVSV